MDSPAIVINGGSPTFQGNVTININIASTIPKAHNMITGMVCDEPDEITVKRSEERLYHEHRGDDGYYQISRHPKGRVLIINNEFRGIHKYERAGSGKDQCDMVDLWDKIGCEVIKASDLTATKLLDKVNEFASSKQETDFCVVIIMSHGKQDDLVVGSEQAEIKVKEIVDAIMSSNSMKNKPKLIFFQMCRGLEVEFDQPDASALPCPRIRDVRQPSNAGDGDQQDTARPEGLGPEVFDTSENTWVMSLLGKVLHHGRILGSSCDEADDKARDYVSETPDVLLAFATQPNHVSFRNKYRGSWFIQSIKNVFSNYAATQDVVEMMTKVQHEVRTQTAYAPGTGCDGGKESVDASDTFGNKRLMLFPGFPDRKPDE